ncbi:hypothetical protein [Oryzifoliimicrobium ureilyticus]|uniref:hypothetical protein n=1 Tax=Oryzifoliimicrobium ureilyticus TaxID=3113724 RepID=UPI0030765708
MPGIVLIAGRHLAQLGLADDDGAGRESVCQADGFSLYNCSIEQWAATCRRPDPKYTLDFGQIAP